MVSPIKKGGTPLVLGTGHSSVKRLLAIGSSQEAFLQSPRGDKGRKDWRSHRTEWKM